MDMAKKILNPENMVKTCPSCHTKFSFETTDVKSSILTGDAWVYCPVCNQRCFIN